jgi:hypothetical protein
MSAVDKNVSGVDNVAVAMWVGFCAASAGGFLLWGRRVARRALQPTVTWQPTVAHIGHPIKVTVSLRPAQDVQVDEIAATLACRRTYNTLNDDFVGRTSITDLWSMMLGSTPLAHLGRDVLCEEQVTCPVSKLFRKGLDERFDFDIVVSPDGVGTKHEGDLTAAWILTVRFVIPGFPDAVIDQEIEVGHRY